MFLYTFVYFHKTSRTTTVVEYGLSTVELNKAQNSFLHQIIIHDKI